MKILNLKIKKYLLIITIHAEMSFYKKTLQHKTPPINLINLKQTDEKGVNPEYLYSTK
jgi:hypothetical protein